MSYRPTFRVVRCAVSSLLLVSGVVALDCIADPSLIGESHQGVSAAPEGDERMPDGLARAERDAAPIDAASSSLPIGLDEIRLDGGSLERRQHWNNAPQSKLDAAQGMPGNFANAFGQSDLLRSPMSRDYGNAGSNPAAAAAAGNERGRSAGAHEPVNAAQAMLWESINNAVKLIRDSVVDETDTVSLSIVGVDFSLTLGGGRPALLVNGADWWPTLLDGSAMEEARPVSAMTTTAALQEQSIHSGAMSGAPAPLPGMPVENPLGSHSKGDVTLIIEKVREFFTDPLTIIAAVGALLIWFSFEMLNSIRERRRWRRLQRAARRAGNPA